MSISKLLIFLTLLAAFLFSGCKSDTKNDSADRKFHKCKDYKLDVPIEMVDVETQGEKSGDTHFPSFSTDTELFFSYNRFESEETALNHLKETEKRAWRIIRNDEIKDSSGNKIGEKTIIITLNSYELLWTKGLMLNHVIGESLAAIEEIEKDCNL